MTIFELTLYACVTTTFPGFDHPGRYSKTCEWQQNGQLFFAHEKCVVSGKEYIGRDIIGNSIDFGATNRYEDAHCVARTVSE
jgi:hypothetical protein